MASSSLERLVRRFSKELDKRGWRINEDDLREFGDLVRRETAEECAGIADDSGYGWQGAKRIREHFGIGGKGEPGGAE